MSFTLISAILRNPWYIDHEFVVSHAPIIGNLITKGPSRFPGNTSEDISKIPYTLSAASVAKVPGNIRDGYNYDHVPKQSKAVIPVKGVLLKEDQDDGCGYFVAGMNTLAKRIHDADMHDNIDAIILHFDSPGGTVDGTQALADAVKKTKKPTIAFVDGLLGSAAYFIASSCDRIIAENSSTLIGSIGTMMSLVDEQPYFEKLGFKIHNIVSDLSPDKNADYTSAQGGNYDPIKKNILNPFARIFQNYVKENRPNLSDSSIQGKVFLAEEALSRNLIDSIGPIESAIATIDELLSLPVNSTTKPKQIMENLPLLIDLLEVESLESTDEGTFFNQDQLLIIEERLATLDSAHSRLMESNEINLRLSGSLEKAENEIKSLEINVSELKSLPASHPASAASSSDRIPDASDTSIQSFENLSTNDAIAALRKGGF
ncbi:MAG: S49 family peptidase [Lentimicrobium sp.]|nr:S49 family peptidase [Lentimicrobium sp.]